MRKTTTYVTVGEGSEMHNHNLDYRRIMTHTAATSHETVIELVPYKSYKLQINEYMKPFIDEYNAKQDEKYLKDWERYNNGELKTKPKKSNKKYRHEDLDFYTKRINTLVYDKVHNKKKNQSAFDEVMIGFGSLETREEFSRNEVVAILKKTLEETKKKFPNILVLGATIHLDEKGNYHMHLDYLPLYFKDKEKKHNGLSVGINIDECMKNMGFHKEESLINRKKKKPLYFNAFRNGIDRLLEEELNRHDILVERGVTADRLDKGHLEKDEWLQTKIAANELQNIRNNILVKTNELEQLNESVEQKIDELDNLDIILDKYEGMSDLDVKIYCSKLENENKVLKQENSILKSLQTQLIKLFNELIRVLEQHKSTKELASQLKKRLEKIFNSQKIRFIKHKEQER